MISVLQKATTPGRHLIDIPVVKTLAGHDIVLKAHVVRGQQDGPTMVIIGLVHGDEFGQFEVMRDFLAALEPARMKGSVVVLPVANPLALAAMSRFTPDLHGNTDLHTVFPGSASGTLTQMLAAAIDSNVVDGLSPDDVLVDMHAGGAGGRLQFRADYDTKVSGALRERVVSLCRVFGTRLLHENKLNGTVSQLANSRGVPTVNIEIGGSFMDEPTNQAFKKKGLKGLHSLAALLGILEAEILSGNEQWVYDTENRIEVNPSAGGYLISKRPDIDDLDLLIEEGELLGEMVDPYTLEVIEELRAPVSGFLFFTRRSGFVEAGGKIFGLARRSGAVCLP